jgi:hypothetical protein
VADARFVLGVVRAQGWERVSARALYQACRGTFATTADLEPALALLKDRGYLAEAAAPRRAGPGRPASPVLVVHPLVVARRPGGPEDGEGHWDSEDSGDCGGDPAGCDEEAA